MSHLNKNIKSSSKRILIFLDEIQECPEAITALKFLTTDNRFDVIASGSLLGVSYKNVHSFPVGYVERLTLYPMDFEEFMWTFLHDELVGTIKENFNTTTPVSNFFHIELIELFRSYVVIGGMPEVVLTYLTKQNYNDVWDVQTRILNDYKNDIAKYASSSERVKVREVFESIPFQLGKDNKKFQYKYVRQGGRSSAFEGSIQWLIDSGMIYKCDLLDSLQIPLAMYKRPDSFKLYMFDIGLLVVMLDKEAQCQILLNNLSIAKGAIYENVIAIALKQNKHNLYYYAKGNVLEIDFITSKNQQVVAIEAKSGDNTKSKSLNTLLQAKEIDLGIRLSLKNISNDDKTLRLPLYLSMFL